MSDRKIGVLNGARRFEVKARTAASKTIEVEVDKPLGLTLGQKQGGGVVITVSFFLLLQVAFFMYICCLIKL